MKAALARWLRSGMRAATATVARSRGGSYLVEGSLDAAFRLRRSVRHRGVTLTFAVPTSLNRFRVDTFSTKEPETLEWIDSIPANAVLWDIGANVGLYSCYAAKARGCRVVAFEPSVFNLELLVRNLALNGVSANVIVVALALSDTVGVNTLHMSTTEWGGALSAFGVGYGQDGRPLDVVLEYQTVGVSIADAVERLGIPRPDHIKLDVDGIEHLILKGGASVLRNVQSVLVEINDEFAQQLTDSTRYLAEAGLVLSEKRHGEMFERSSFRNSYNQIWRRTGAAT